MPALNDTLALDGLNTKALMERVVASEMAVSNQAAVDVRTGSVGDFFEAAHICRGFCSRLLFGAAYFCTVYCVNIALEGAAQAEGSGVRSSTRR